MPEFPNKKYKTSTELCESILDDTGVAMLPASDFGFGPKKMLTRLCYIDFDGNEFLKATINGKIIDDQIIELENSSIASIVVPPMQYGIFLLDRK